MIPASRVFVKSADSITATPVSAYANYSFKTNGQTPAGWIDLGVMDAPAKLMYTKTLGKLQTGVEKISRRTYSTAKEANLDFSLWQTGTTTYLLSALRIQRVGCYRWIFDEAS